VLESVVLKQFGDDIKASVMEVLAENAVTNAKVSVNDRGAIDCTIRARVETALKRAQGDN
jgi:citrate lyase subunit gamma (acyl carrier protein)